MHAQGRYNVADNAVWPEWVANKSYTAGDSVTYNGQGVICKTANSDAEFDFSKWILKDFEDGGEIAFVIGNGIRENARSNAFSVNWSGDTKAAGDVYANYDFANGTGDKLATEAYVNEHSGSSDEYALKTDTVLNTTLSRGRVENSAVGEGSFAFGQFVTASGVAAHAEGAGTTASGAQSHAEGGGSRATGSASHAEGGGSQAIGNSSHAEGSVSQATGNASHAEGSGTQATGDQSHAEGSGTQATSMDSHAEGLGTIANGTGMHAQGRFNVSDPAVWPEWAANTSYALWDGVIYNGHGYVCKTPNSDAEFDPSKWTSMEFENGGEIAFVIGNGTADNARSNAFLVKWDGSVQAGYGSQATGSCSHAEGLSTKATGSESHAEGDYTQATGRGSHAEGENAQATGTDSHAEGLNTLAAGYTSHAEGSYAQATGDSSHAEGSGTTASGDFSHAEGNESHATGVNSHAEGRGSQATGYYSHAEGYRTIANGANMHVQGRYNVADSAVWPEWVANTSYAVGDGVIYNGRGAICKTANSDAKFDSSKWTFKEFENGGEIAFIIGNGTAESARSNAFQVDWDGDIKTAGNVYANYNFENNTGDKLATESYVTEAVAQAGGGGGGDLSDIESRLDVLEGDEETDGSVAQAMAKAEEALDEAQNCVLVDQGRTSSGHMLWVDGNGQVSTEIPGQLMLRDASGTKTFVLTINQNGGLVVSEVTD